MTAYRIIDDHKELENVGENTHDDLDIHVDTTAFLVASGSLNVPTDARILTPGANIAFLDGGPGGNFVISVSGSLSSSPGGSNTNVQFNDSGSFGGISSFTFDKDTDTLTVVNLSGSLTHLSDGTSYLIAGNNITITTGSNGAVTINSTATGGGGGNSDPDATYLVLSTTGSLTNERAFVASTGLVASDGGANSNYTLSINDSVVATISGSTFTGVVNFNAGLSGSLTQLTDGSSYLVAGGGIQITSSSNGQVTVETFGTAPNTPSYLTLSNDASLTNERAFTPGTGLSGSDGGANGSYTLSINDSVVATVSGTTFTGATRHNAGLSGSLTQLTNGDSYLVAGPGISIVSQSNGSILITGSTQVTPGGLDTYVQFNDGGILGGDSNFTFDKTTSALTVTNLSGSLTQLSDGTSYLVAGGGISITSASNGSITITGNLGDITSVTAGNGLLGGGTSGDVTLDIDDSVVATLSGSTFTGAVNFSAGLSGSLTQLTDGTSYLIAGPGISIVSQSNGSILITGSQVIPGGADTYIQFNDGGNFGGDSGLTYDKNTDTLTGVNVILSGDLTVNGTTVTVNTTNLEVKDSVIGLGFSSGTIAETSGDRGIIGGISGNDNVTFLWKDAQGEFVFGRTQSSATGSLPIPLTQYSNIHAANIQGSIITASLGFSGSLTRLSDGTSYLIAGGGITITSASNGSVTITGNLGDITSVTAGIGLTGGGNSGDVTLDINDSVVATISGSTFTGVTNHNAGLSGSLTRLTDGTSYLNAGTNINIVSSSNGSITISAPGLASTSFAYVTIGNDSDLTNERALTAGTGLTLTDAGANSTVTLGVNDSVVATLSGSTFTGAVNFNAGLSGSLTQLIDGTSYLIAGNNITITTGSNGAVTINSTATGGGGGSGDPDATYLVLSTTGSLSNERAFVASTGLLASDAGPNGNYTLSINDSVVATLSGSTFTGPVNFNSGLSGSLTQLVDGSSYLIAGSNVTITSSSNGPITISATAGAAVPGGSDTQVQFNDSNTFGGDANFTFNKTTNTLTVDNVSGSLTRLVDGTSYLVAGDNVVITTGSNGSVTISAPTVNQISLMSWMEVPSGDVDGVNMVYTLAYNPSPINSLMFYVNGVLQKQGLAHDYDLSSNTVIMSYAPQTGSNVIATYAYVTTPPVGTYTSWMEIPGGIVDGSNTTFTLANTPWPSSALMLYINGVLQKQGGANDYTLSSSVISMNYAPQTGSNVLATYPY